MQSFIVDRYQKSGELRLGEMPEPEMGDTDILVRIEAAGLNPLDAKVWHGDFKLILPYRPPFILGHELAGTVVRVGSKVRGFKLGDEVYARPRDGRIGTFAKTIAVAEGDAAMKPSSLSMEEAASIPLVGLTSWQVLVERANIQPGQKVLIHAGSGGVGTFAIQLAKHLGATVATTTSAHNVALVRSLGADVIIDYKKEDFEKVLSGYDLALSGLDGKTLAKSLNVLKPGGKLISLSGPPDPEFAKYQGLGWPLRQVMRFLSRDIRSKARARDISYSFLFMHASGDQLRQITSLIEAGVIRPVVDRVFPFQATNEAMAYVEAGRAKGKVVINMTTPLCE